MVTPGSASPPSLLESLRGVTGRGADPRGRVTVELDGTGALVDVEISSTAMDGNKGALEAALREAHAAARTALQDRQRELAPRLAAEAREQVGDLVAEARSLQQTAKVELDRAIAAVSAAAARATGGAA